LRLSLPSMKKHHNAPPESHPHASNRNL
jgi:hypothetical protein